MVRVPKDDTAASRARWLAELAGALDEARILTTELFAAEGSGEALELHARIEAASFTVRAMRLMRSGGAAFDPDWIKDIPWKRSA